MKQVNLMFLTCLLVLIPSVGKAQSAVQQAMDNFVTLPNKDKTISIDKTTETDTTGGRHAFAYCCYTFSLKKKAKTELKPLIDAFNNEIDNAYTVFTKSDEDISSNKIVIDLDNFRNNIEFGGISWKNYQVLLFHDTERPAYRYAYALVYWKESRSITTGRLYKIYSRDPSRAESSNSSNAYADLLNDSDLHGNVIVIPNKYKLYDGNIGSKNFRKLQKRMKEMNNRMAELNRRMGQLSKDPIKNSKRRNQQGAEMNALGDSINMLGNQMMKENYANMNLLMGNTLTDSVGNQSSAMLVRQFGIYYDLYQEALAKHKDNVHIAGLLDMIYKLCDKKSLLKGHPDIVEAWRESLTDLQQKETNGYRKRVLKVAIQNLMK